MHHPRGNVPAFLWIEPDAAERTRHNRAVDWLGRMTRPPTDNITAHSRLSEDVPKGLHFARGACVGARPSIHRIWLDETMDPVLIRELPGRDGVPQHRRKNRLKR